MRHIGIQYKYDSNKHTVIECRRYISTKGGLRPPPVWVIAIVARTVRSSVLVISGTVVALGPRALVQDWGRVDSVGLKIDVVVAKLNWQAC